MPPQRQRSRASRPPRRKRWYVPSLSYPHQSGRPTLRSASIVTVSTVRPSDWRIPLGHGAEGRTSRLGLSRPILARRDWYLPDSAAATVAHRGQHRHARRGGLRTAELGDEPVAVAA